MEHWSVLIHIAYICFFLILVWFVLNKILDIELKVESIDKVLSRIPLSFVEKTPVEVVVAPPPPPYNQVEKQGLDEEGDDDEVIQIVTSELDDKQIMLEPQHFDSPQEMSTRLKKMPISRLTEIASEKNISITPESGKKRLTKKEIIEKILSV